MDSLLKKPSLFEKKQGWKCENCSKENEINTVYCSQCENSKYKSESSQFWSCSSCNRLSSASDDNCYFCSRPKVENRPQAEQMEKSDSWKCWTCEELNEDWRMSCQRCHEIKGIESRERKGYKLEWNCDKCANKNFANEYICKYCNHGRKLEKEAKKCLECNCELEYVNCPSCGKINNSANENCPECRKSLSKAELCYICSLNAKGAPEKQSSFSKNRHY